MMGRDRRTRANMKARIGIATAVVVGGAAIGVAVASTSHGAAAAAKTGYTVSSGSEWSMLNSAMTTWRTNQQASYTSLTGMTQQTYSQTSQNNRTLAEQRGIVVLATSKFLILQSANGSLHLWLLSGTTQLQNVSSTTSGTTALTASTTAAQQAMTTGNMIPATTALAGSPLTAMNMLTPSSTPQTVKVTVAGTNLTVTVTVTGSTATVAQTATMPLTGTPKWWPTKTTTNAWTTATTTSTLARGDLALVVGTRTNNLLHAQLVLFTPLTTNAMGSISCPSTGTGTPTSSTIPATSSSSGTHT